MHLKTGVVSTNSASFYKRLQDIKIALGCCAGLDSAKRSFEKIHRRSYHKMCPRKMYPRNMCDRETLESTNLSTAS